MNLIMAVDNEWNIGKDDQLLTHISADLQRFKRLTEGQVVVMGRNTYESLPVKPLPDRMNIVITSKPETLPKEVIGYSSIKDFLEGVNDLLLQSFVVGWVPDIFVIGGGNLIEQLEGKCDKAFVTKIDHVFPEANKSMLDLDKSEKWKKVLEMPSLGENKFNFTYCLYVK